jgi:hypothetical protein
VIDKQLQGLLDEIRKGGVHDSVGSFSLDRFSAARKLARTQFPSHYHYALKLVQWAVASHARSVRITVWPGSLDITHDGIPVGDKLPDLIRFALSSPIGPDRRLVHLASAILAVQALGPRKVAFHSQGQVLEVLGDKDKLSKVSAGAERPDRIVISGLPWRPAAATEIGLIGLVRPEVQLLAHHCAYSEIPVYVGRVPLSRAFLGIREHVPRVVKGRTRLYIPAGHALPVRVALAPYDVDAAISVPGPETAGVFPQGRYWMRSAPEVFSSLAEPRRPEPAPSEAIKLSHLTLGDFPMYRGWAIMLDYTGNLEHRLTAAFRSNSIKLIQDGVLIETVQPLLSERRLMAEGIVATGSLPLDLSHFRYVRGEGLSSLVREIGHFLELGR